MPQRVDHIPRFRLSDDVSDRLVGLRHRLHAIPELGYEEFNTADLIRAELARLGIDCTPGTASCPTATIAVLGRSQDPCIALRADIDALPILERTGLPYASQNPGRMHACGHDGHMAILLGAAENLAGRVESLGLCVKLIFQPAEEGGGGADRLVRAGVLDGTLGPAVRSIYGLHGWPGLPVGFVSTRAGPVLAATDTFSVTFVGRGCHAAFPQMGVDPIVTAAEAVLNLQQFVSREIDPTEPAVITIGQFNAGSANNVIPDSAVISGTARTLNPDTRRQIAEAIERRCRAIATANGATIDFKWVEGYPPTVNDPAASAYVADTAARIVGADRNVPAPRPAMGGEDFAYYLEKVPGCFFFIGVCPPERATYPSLHSDQFDFTDEAIRTGVEMLVALVEGHATQEPAAG